MFFNLSHLNVYELCSSLLTPNGLGNRLNSQLHYYTKNLFNEVSSNEFIPIDFGSSPELANGFRPHHLGVLEEVVDSAQDEVGFSDFLSILQ